VSALAGETLRKREFKFLAQMVVIEISVMFFEVMFLYRQFIDALTPGSPRRPASCWASAPPCRWRPSAGSASAP
jgi:hypothetical protein